MNEIQNNQNNVNNSSNNLKENNKNTNGEDLKKLNKEKSKDSIRSSSIFEVLGIKSKDKYNYDKISSDLKKYEKEFNINVSHSNRKKYKT